VRGEKRKRVRGGTKRGRVSRELAHRSEGGGMSSSQVISMKD